MHINSHNLPNSPVGKYYRHTVFCFTNPFLKKFKIIPNHFSSLHFPPYFLQTNINATLFQSLRYFTPLLGNIPHSMLKTKVQIGLDISRFSHHSSSSALNFSSRVQCFLFNLIRHWYRLWGTLGWMYPIHCQYHNKAIILAKF